MHHHDDRFHGATALVTGGSRGLGLLIAGELADRGARVMICARDPQELATAERELSSRGTVASTVCDLAEPDAPERLVAATVERFGRLDVLVNNAGLIQVGPLEAFTAEDFDRALDVMVRAPVRLVLAALPGMRERRSGTVVTVSSIGGRIPAPHLLPYVTAKFALAGLSAGLRAELAADGISVTTVLPGLMRTGSHRAAAFAGRPEREYAWFGPAASLPLLSMDASRAARAIVRAAERGRPELVLTPAAKLGSRVYGLAPATTTRALTLAARLLPSAGARPSRPVAGTDAAAEAERRYPPVGALTGLGDRAGRGTNEPQ
ncbi:MULTISPECIES: SDR family NAD(P)-dependent oxidoreductase [Kitasatospora]|uniref:SDR family oxidoreductase n=1 Tax=Kitasatospora arboriphila TaxID=258052 RepID=A0ABP4E791_9ACTN